MGEHNAVVAISNTQAEAETAMKELTHAGFPIKKLSIVGQGYRPAKHVEGYSSSVDCMKYGSTTISGIGPVLIAGPLLGWVLGAIEVPVVADGITAIGTALKSMGIPKDSVLSYETALRFNKFILLVHGTAEEVAHAQNIVQTKRARAIVDREARVVT
ncbi:MAG: permease [Nitrospira sp.]|nr:permease [Nitrospira sp.]